MLKFLTIIKRLPVDFNQRDMGDRSKAKKIAFRLLKKYSPPKAVLDLGCRDGVWARELLHRGYEVVAADLEPHYPGAITMDADRPFPFPDGRFDLVWATEVIEHLRKPSNAAAEIRRVLAPKGGMILTTPNSYFWLFYLLVFFGKFFGKTMADFQNPDHKQFYSYEDIRRIFPQATIYGFFPYFGPFRYAITCRPLVSFCSPVFVIHERK